MFRHTVLTPNETGIGPDEFRHPVLDPSTSGFDHEQNWVDRKAVTFVSQLVFQTKSKYDISTMFAMKAIKSIRGSSVLMKGPIFVASLLRREGPTRPGPETNGIGTMSTTTLTKLETFAGTVAMNTRVWLGNGRQAWGNLMGKIHVKTVWDNLHVCVGGKTAAAAEQHSSPTAMTFGSLVVSRLFLFRRCRSEHVHPLRKFPLVQEIKEKAAATMAVRHTRSEHRGALVAELKSIPATEFTRRFLRCAAAVAVAGQATTGLAAADVKALQDYSGEGYVEINGSLRQNEFTESAQDRVVAVVRALAKMPKHQKGKVYRGTDMPSDDTRFVVGGEFQDSAFLSTSKTRKRAFDKPYLFIIHKSSTGVDIMKQSVKRSEQEVLFPPGTRFLITSVKTEMGEDNSGWKTIVEMEEIARRTTR
jgi:hypothetical protein